MHILRYFDPKRFLLLLKLELFRSKKGFVITFVITFGLLFTGFIIENIFSNSRIFDSHADGYASFMLAAGFILSSLAFADLGNPLKRYNYLVLPASTLEKFLSMWFLTCIAWIVLFSVLYFIYTLLANSAGAILFHNMTFKPFRLFDMHSLKVIRYYIVFQSVFLVGAVHFRGFVFPKVLLTVLLFALLCGLIFYLMMTDIIHADFTPTPQCNPLNDPSVNKIWHVIQWLMWWVLAPLSWVTAYIGLKEQEV